MRYRRLITIAAPVLATFVVAGCGTTASPTIPPSSRLIHVAGLPAGKIILSALGAQRIGLKTSPAGLTAVPPAKPSVPVRASAHPKSHAKPAVPRPVELVTVPYSALVYTPTGRTYVFSNIGRLTYTEVQVTINHINGNVVFLTSGVKAGTPIVTVGAEELYGVQSGVLAQT